MTEKAKDIIARTRIDQRWELTRESLERLAAEYIDDAVDSLPEADASTDPGPESAQAQTLALIGIGHALLAISHQLSNFQVSISQ
jgi:hypothetical protein